MRDIFKNVFHNVEIKDSDGNILFKKSNLFVNSGRQFIRDVFSGDITFDNSNVCLGLGSDKLNAPSPTDVSITFLDSPAQTPLVTTPVVTAGPSDTEVSFAFSYTNPGPTDPISFKELGLFYDEGGTLILLARLTTTYSSLNVAMGNTITVTWKILF